jgi:hypothetical protein
MKKINKIYKADFLSPKDFHNQFRHITNRALVTRIRMREQVVACRFCGTAPEHIIHLGRCPKLKALLRKLHTLSNIPSPTIHATLFAHHTPTKLSGHVTCSP